VIGDVQNRHSKWCKLSFEVSSKCVAAALGPTDFDMWHKQLNQVIKTVVAHRHRIARCKLADFFTGDQPGDWIVIPECHETTLVELAELLGFAWNQTPVGLEGEKDSMEIGDSPAEAEFRAQARSWLHEHGTPRSLEAPDSDSTTDAAEDPVDLAQHVAAAQAWQAKLHQHGWAGLAIPVDYGGRGATPIQAAIFYEEMANVAETIGPLTVALGMVAPTLIAHGNIDQKRHIAPILRGEELWCQLFSEPGAGSDLASLATRAVSDGDNWIVNGQKVWTSLGQFARYGILLARTDIEAPKHQGITYFIVDMTDPGIEIRPLRQITGQAHFNEVFLNDVVVPHANVVGEVGDGWSVARTTLTSERAAISGSGAAWSAERLVEAALKTGRSKDPNIRQALAKAYTRQVILKILGYRLRTALSHQRMPGREALVMKLAYANHWVDTTSTALEIFGVQATTAPEYGPANHWYQLFLNQYAIRLGGGTDEVQRNIIAEMGLGLPREPSLGKGVPWKNLPR